MKIFYMPAQSVEKNSGFSPSAGKPALFVEAVRKLDPKINLSSFEPVSRHDLYQVHDKKYVNAVLDCKHPNGFGNKYKSVARALPYVAGSMVAAALHSFKTGETTFSPSSGFHHACYGSGGGFCTFNGLVLAAVEAMQAGAETVGILDCDAHGGNGTKDIIETLDLGFIQHYSFGYDKLRDVAKNNVVWLSMFTMLVQDMAHACDLIIFNAGADASINDPLSTNGLTNSELALRDEIVFRACANEHTPVAVSLAGGYQEPLSKVIKIHTNTYKLARLYETKGAL